MKFLFFLGAVWGLYVMYNGKGITRPLGLCIAGFCCFMAGFFDKNHPGSFGLGLILLIIGIIWCNSYSDNEKKRVDTKRNSSKRTVNISTQELEKIIENYIKEHGNNTEITNPSKICNDKESANDVSATDHIPQPPCIVVDNVVQELPAPSKQKTPLTADERAHKNRKARLRRRKLQIQNEPEKTLDLIVAQKWKFSTATRDHSSSGYIWNCTDKDGITITGKVTTTSTTIYFHFDNDVIELDPKYCSRLENMLVSPSELESIKKWRNEKRNYYKNNHTASYSPTYSTYIHTGPRCMYCKTELSFGNVCNRCRNLYSKKRHGVGGYPSYDPNAQGSNGRN